MSNAKLVSGQPYCCNYNAEGKYVRRCRHCSHAWMSDYCAHDMSQPSCPKCYTFSIIKREPICKRCSGMSWRVMDGIKCHKCGLRYADEEVEVAFSPMSSALGGQSFEIKRD